MSTTAMNPRHRLDVQGLRAIAVLLVIAYHAGVPIHGGFIGVDVFFVISGFVITARLLRELASETGLRFRGFYAGRIKRLIPALGLVVLFVLVMSVLFQSPLGEQQRTAETGIGAMLFAANGVILKTTGGYFDALATSNPLIHTWSLSVEEQFYLIFPAVLFVGWRIGRRLLTPLRVAAIAIGAVTVGSLLLELKLSAGSSKELRFAFYSSPTRAWEFGAGALIAALVASERWALRAASRVAGLIVGLVGAAVLVVANIVIDGDTRFPGAAALLPVIGTSLLILAGNLGQNPITSVLASRVPVYLGDISYSLYLWHWPFISFALLLWPHGHAVAFTAAVLSAIPAILSYHRMENPIRRGEIARLRKVAVVAIVSIGAPLALSGVAYAAGPHAVGSDAAAYASQRDEPTIGRQKGCFLEGSATYKTSLIKKCTFPAKTTGTSSKGWILLAGDSHAESLSNGVIKAGNALGYDVVVLTGTSCLLMRNPPATPTLRGCKALSRGVLDLAEHAPTKPSAIVMGHFSTSRYLSGNWPQQIAPTLDELSTAKIPVLYALDVPLFGDITDQGAPACSGGAVTFQCAQPLARITARGGSVRDLERRLVATYSLDKVLDLWPAFCTATQCSPVLKGKLLYTDSQHLNKVGSSYIAPLVEKGLQAVIR